ncbi:MAG TPA: IS481 family transposase [Bauldia sp.]|nr:IS481 family transposase [Bauldia sp.]
MPWQERSIMVQRQEFVTLVQQDGLSIAAACRCAGISRPTGYRWLARAAAGEQDFTDRSRRPHHAPRRTSAETEAAVLALRAQHPAWGGRKLHHALAREGMVQPPAASTITAILRRHGQLLPIPPRRDFRRFERDAPNDLWQLDFMGHRPLARGRVHPLTIVDDHSRFALCLTACADEQQSTVQAHLTAVFRAYGLPQAILADHGSPWGTAGRGGLTTLEAWLLQLGIDLWHGRPQHPQTRGKVERFHRTIAVEVFAGPRLPDLREAQTAFDAWRALYNAHRPHEALDDGVPAERYQPSPRPFPATLPEVIYAREDVVCPVTLHGSITWQGRRVFVSRGLVGQPVAVRPTLDAAVWTVHFCQRQVAVIDLRDPDEV